MTRTAHSSDMFLREFNQKMLRPTNFWKKNPCAESKHNIRSERRSLAVLLLVSTITDGVCFHMKLVFTMLFMVRDPVHGGTGLEVLKHLAGLVGLGQEVFEISRDGSGRFQEVLNLAGRDGLP